MTSNEPLVVQAVYSFKGKNNDELCLKKGDIVIVTQKEDGGWWEGTLKEKTGWFPSNYVKEYKPQGENITNNKVPNIPLDLTEQLRANRAVVVMDIVESERAHVTELKTLIQSFLIPLKNSNIMTIDEYNQLVNNIEEVSKTHEGLLESLEQVSGLPQSDQRIGKLFLNKASFIRSVHLQYCASHPRAVNIIDKYKDELNQIIETQGAVSPGILVLTVSLSKPFRRLYKYSGMLQELERHLEESHVDRGDTQRSISIYKEIATVCLSTRKQKELELSILSGVVQGWEGTDTLSLGDAIKIGSVAFGAEHKDRYLMLFSTHLVILSVSQRLSSFIYEYSHEMAQWQMSETNMDSYIEEMYEDEPVLTQREIIQQMYAEIPDEVNHDISVEEDKDRTWSVESTKFLITLRVSYSSQFLSAKKKGKKSKLWELISNEMAEKGYSFSPKVCDEKWRRLSTQHRKYYDLSKKSGNNAIKWQYYKLMDEAIIPLGKKQSISPPKELLNESSQPSYSEPCSSNSTSTTMTSNIILNPPLLTIPTPSQSTISPTLTPNYTCSTFKAKTPSWFEKYENMKKDQISTQSIELNKRLDKLEKREHEMLEVQKQLVDKLNTANDIEIQKLDMFKKMFKID